MDTFDLNRQAAIKLKGIISKLIGNTSGAEYAKMFDAPRGEEMVGWFQREREKPRYKEYYNEYLQGGKPTAEELEEIYRLNNEVPKQVGRRVAVKKEPTTPQVREKQLEETFLQDIKALAPDDAPTGSRKAVEELEKDIGNMVQRQIETDKYYSHKDLTDRISKGFDEVGEITDALEKGGVIQLAYKRNNKNSKALETLYRQFDNNNKTLQSNKLLDE